MASTREGDVIRVTVELIPGGLGPPTHLGTARIANDGTGTAQVGHYTVRLSKRGRPASLWKQGRVWDFPRQRLGAWDLLYAALDALVGSRVRRVR